MTRTEAFSGIYYCKMPRLASWIYPRTRVNTTVALKDTYWRLNELGQFNIMMERGRLAEWVRIDPLLHEDPLINISKNLM